MTPDINAADVPITLNGKPAVLKFTLAACRTLAVGDFIAHIGRAQRHDFEAMANTIAAGLGVERTEELDNSIFETGLINLEIPVTRYLLNLNRGGPPPVEADDKKAKAEDPQKKA